MTRSHYMVVERVTVPLDRSTQEERLQRLRGLLLRGAQRLAQADGGASTPAGHSHEGGQTDE